MDVRDRRSGMGWAAGGRRGAGSMEPPTAQRMVSRANGRGGSSGRRTASQHRPTCRARRKQGRHAPSPRRRSRTGWAASGRRGAGLMELPTAPAAVSRPVGCGRRGARRKRGSHARSPRRSRAVWAANGRRGTGLFERPTVWPISHHQWPRPGAAAGLPEASGTPGSGPRGDLPPAKV